MTASAWHCFFLMCKEILNRIYNWAVASGFCDVSALRSAECGSFGEEGQLCRERVTSGARPGTGQHPWALNPLLPPQQSCLCPRGWDQARNQVLIKRTSPGGSCILTAAGNPCWQQASGSVSWVGETGCQSWFPAWGAHTGPCWGCTPGSSGFAFLPPRTGFRRFGELCAW